MSSPTVFVLKPSAQVTKGGAMPQFRILFYAIYYPGDPKGGHRPMAPPINMPLDSDPYPLSTLETGKAVYKFKLLYT